MVKFLKFFLSAIIIVTIALGMYTYTNKYDVDILMEGVNVELLTKGCEDSIGITKGDNDDIYIAFDDEIVRIDNKNKVNKVYRDSSFDIDDLAYKDGVIYLLSKQYLISIDKDGNKKILKDNLLYKGENIDRNLLIKEDSILISIGAATNSGIVKEGGVKDISPINLKLNGVNYGENKTGIFKNYGDDSKESEEIVAQETGNASIIEFNTKTLETKLFASGIRNIEAYDINSSGEIFAVVGGMKEEGERGIIRDSDYIYNIKQGLWYGWPDFSGGDPISSPRFSDEKLIEPLIKNPPEKMGQTPYYQDNSVDSLKELVIDKDGDLLNKDDIIFYDGKEKILYSLGKNNAVQKLIKLDKDSDIEDIIIVDDSCLLLDREKGYIYKLTKNSSIVGDIMPRIMAIIILVFMIVILGVSLFYIKKYKKQ